jgi:hypothetical protein
MAYATVFHVEAKNAARGVYTANTVPNATQVIQFIEEAAGKIDACLHEAGYSTPISASGTPSSVLLQLQHINAVGAAFMVETSARTSMKEKRDEFEEMWKGACKMIKSGDLPGLDKSAAESHPRGSGNATAMFTATMVL